jgi:hypothetical protein
MAARKPASIAQVRWQPGGAYALAVQAFTIARLRGKASREHFESPQRVHFYVLTGVTRGRTRHEIDFRSIDAAPGTWMLLRPGQIQRFDFSRDWDGWMIVFRPDLVPPVPARGRGASDALAAGTGALEPLLAGLATAQRPSRAVHARCAAAARRIDDDARRHGAAVDACNALLRHELGELLARLALAAPVPAVGRAANGPGDSRMARLRAWVQSQPTRRPPWRPRNPRASASAWKRCSAPRSATRHRPHATRARPPCSSSPSCSPASTSRARAWTRARSTSWPRASRARA